MKILYKAKHGGICLEKLRQEDHGAEANLDCPVPSDLFFFFYNTAILFLFLQEERVLIKNTQERPSSGWGRGERLESSQCQSLAPR